jgi:hypothetical protein
MSSVQFVVATSLSLLVFVALANLVVDLYARGVVRSAIDEGARAGAPIDAGEADCEQRAKDVLSTLLGGSLDRTVAIDCRDEHGRMTAGAEVVLGSWLPGIVPSWSFEIAGSATKERDP